MYFLLFFFYGLDFVLLIKIIIRHIEQGKKKKTKNFWKDKLWAVLMIGRVSIINHLIKILKWVQNLDGWCIVNSQFGLWRLVERISTDHEAIGEA